MAVTSELITQDCINGMIRQVRATITGLEKLSDGDVAAYLNLHPTLVTGYSGIVPVAFTANMVHEIRTARI